MPGLGLVALVGASLIAGPTTDTINIAIPPLRIIEDGGPPIAAEDRQRWSDAVTTALALHNLEPVAVQHACVDAACFSEVAQSSEAWRIVSVSVMRTTNDYSIGVTVHDADGRAVDSASASCEICTPADVTKKVEETVAGLGPALAGAEPLPDTTPDTTGAAVPVHGEHVGETPVEGAVAVPGHAEEPALPATNQRWMFTTGLALIGAGAASVIGGAVLVAIDSRPVGRRCHGDAIDINGACEWLHDTRIGGAVALGIGGAALAAGVALAVLGRKDRGRPWHEHGRVRIRPTASGVELAF